MYLYKYEIDTPLTEAMSTERLEDGWQEDSTAFPTRVLFARRPNEDRKLSGSEPPSHVGVNLRNNRRDIYM